ncbi:MAG TPA: hypothetical protein VNI61_03050 [Gemmatimonadales bacterium]|nr:hypothetical protein [Gemmatimonadales bacterium]
MVTVYVVTSCDTDPDRPGLLDGGPPGRLTWKGMTEGVPALKDAVRGLHDSRGREPVFTWLLRADEQIRSLHGEYAWPARAHQSLWRSLEQSGDELGWHPHFWRRPGGSGPWAQELDDVDWQVEMLRRAHADLAECLPGGVQSVRMGWAYHNNHTCRALDDLGLAVDLSPLPGYRTLTARARPKGENLFDWYPSPRTPFRPSRTDYRRPPRPGEESYRLLEVPSFVSTSVPWALIGGLQLARKTGDPGQIWQVIRRPTYCINVTARPRYFAPLVAQLRRALRRGPGGPLVFSTQFHADEVVPNRSRLYELGSVRRNLEAVVRACTDAGVPVEFVPARRLPALLA